MTRRTSDFTLSLLASIGAFLLSWPFWRDFEYWPESRVAWWIYFVLGFVLSVYVFYVFIGSLHTIFLHGAHGHGAHEDPAPPANDPGVVVNKERRS